MDIKFYSTSDEITVFWDSDFFGKSKYEYLLFADEKLISKTNKTHYTFLGLTAFSEYKIKIEAYEEDTRVSVYEKCVFTKKQKNKIDITKPPYNALGDAISVNTQAIQSALDRCTKDDYVYFPKGIFLCGALNLHSDTEIYLEKDAVLQGTDNSKDYLPLIPSRFEGIERKCYSSLINIGKLDSKGGINCKDILIHGKGSILGAGAVLAQNIIDEEIAKPGYAQLCKKEHYDDFEVPAGRIRPRLINISNAQNIIMKGLTIGNSPCWNVHMIYSEDIITNDCKFISKGVWNGDCWDPDSSKNCTIFDCSFESGDDCIAVKSGKNPEGNIINRFSENINIFDCRAIEGLGGVAIGSEMSGGVENVKIWDCDFTNVRYGIQIKATKKRGGYVRNIFAKRCIIPSILIHSVWYNDDGIGASEPPFFENCFFEDIEITGKPYVKPAAKTFDGIPDDVDYCSIDISGFDNDEYAAKNINFKNINIRQIGGENQKIMLKFCKGISFENILCTQKTEE